MEHQSKGIFLNWNNKKTPKNRILKSIEISFLFQARNSFDVFNEIINFKIRLLQRIFRSIIFFLVSLWLKENKQQICLHEPMTYWSNPLFYRSEKKILSLILSKQGPRWVHKLGYDSYLLSHRHLNQRFCDCWQNACGN